MGYSSFVFKRVKQIVEWNVSSRKLSSTPKQDSDEMTIGKMHTTVIYSDYPFTSYACKTVTCLNFAICRDKYNRDNPFIRKSRPLATAVVIVTHLITYQKPVLDLEVLEPKSKKAEFDKTLL